MTIMRGRLWDNGTVMVCKFGLMVRNIKDTGRRIERMVAGVFGTQMAINLKVTLYKINRMVKGLIPAQMVRSTQANG